MPNAPQPSVRFLLAREAPVAVLLRRGPSNLIQMLSWDLETDKVTPGQWLSGRVYVERCDLSPDGKLFVYFAADFKSKDLSEHSWTAISRPPYFTALALWLKGPTYNGGGLFESNAHLLINDIWRHQYSDKFPKPEIRVGSFEISADHVEELRMVRDGWMAERSNAKPRVLTRTFEGLNVTETLTRRNYMEIRTYTASVQGRSIDTRGAKQVDIDAARRRIVYTVGGRVLTSDGTTIKVLADLTDNKFQPLPPAKWTTEWP